jgi:hypothetical protein
MTKLTLALLTLCFAGDAFAQAPAVPAREPAPVSPNDYSLDGSWLCKPGRNDACSVDLATTIVNADGSFAREEWKGDPNAPIDCFYVYPTISTDPTPFSDMNADPAELNVIRQQFARFGSVCRTYAPLYRQVTLAGLRRAIAGGGGGASLSRGPQYDDVRDAWRYYLEHDNRGRGVVLIGHSQGSFILTELIRQEIDGKPAQSRLVSAVLLGATLSVPSGKDVGGSFQHIPLCRTPAQTGALLPTCRSVRPRRRPRTRVSEESPSRAWSRPAPTRLHSVAAVPHCTRIWPRTAARSWMRRPLPRGWFRNARSRRPGSACLVC